MLDPADARKQHSSWTCGPAALRHALLWHSHRTNARDLAALSITKCCGKKTVKDGRCEHGLGTAADYHGFRLIHRSTREEAEAYRMIREALVHAPVLGCLDAETHWVTFLRGTTRHAWIADSSRDQAKLVQRWTWRCILRRLRHGLADEIPFHVYAVVPMAAAEA